MFVGLSVRDLLSFTPNDANDVHFQFDPGEKSVLAAAQVREKKLNEESRAVKHKLRKSILKEAEIVATTLRGRGGDLYAVCAESISSHKFGSPNKHTLFDAIVIDEAAQELEHATLISVQLLKSKVTKCIMVGVPKQLPAMVISNVAKHKVHSGNIWFVADARRMNVALTRAKFSMWILGNGKTLMTNKNWEALLKDVKSNITKDA
ncbi:hypothetical protein POM88_041101 [Heracleum sosnowskyi]|uniref:DNA2/NAM7 helicase helicase domain-containing protein n=1 Tax=Heracleum sosnowskyi TaxID=360622 RepID=A0AAD8HDJ1_9APIA|nr:hypothetical protein POM88_041101 [Heracleum sosnowskyi]